MNTRTVALGVFAVVLLAVVVGAPGLFGGDDPGGTPTPDPASTPTPIPGAPGVGAETLENVTALLKAYNGSMTNVGFVAEARSADGTTVYTYARDGSRMIDIDRGNGSRVLWTNGTVSLTRDVSDGNVTYSRPPDAFLSTEKLTRSSRFEALLTGARYERNGTVPCGDTTCVVLTAEGSSQGTWENFTATVHVDETGVIHRFEYSYRRTVDDRLFDVEFTVTELGTASVERPDWVEDGLASTE